MNQSTSRSARILLGIGLTVPSAAFGIDAASAATSSLPDDAPDAISVVYIGDHVTLADYPTLVAWETLRDEGVDVEFQFVAEDSLGVQALLRGGAEFAVASPLDAIAVYEAAPDVRSFFDWKRQGWVLATTPDIEAPEDLEGGTLAVHDPQSFTNTVAQLFIEEYGLEGVEIVTIPGSEVRAQALATGQIDATVLDVQDVVLLDVQAPGTAEILASFAETYPELTSGRWLATQSWIDEHPEFAVHVAEVMLEANRQVVADPEGTIAEALAREEYADFDDAIIEGTIQAFIDNNLWTLNGGLTEANAEAELAFYFEAGQSDVDPAEADLESMYSLPTLQAALESVGTVEE